MMIANAPVQVDLQSSHISSANHRFAVDLDEVLCSRSGMMFSLQEDIFGEYRAFMREMEYDVQRDGSNLHEY
jgi:hypothetical protein